MTDKPKVKIDAENRARSVDDESRPEVEAALEEGLAPILEKLRATGIEPRQLAVVVDHGPGERGAATRRITILAVSNESYEDLGNMYLQAFERTMEAAGKPVAIIGAHVRVESVEPDALGGMTDGPLL